MYTPHLFKTIRTIFERSLRPPVFDEFPTPGGIERIPDPQQEFMHRVQRIFAERGFEKVEEESALDEQYLMFTRNDALHLVYCLPYETYVTTIEIQACWEAQLRAGAKSSSVAAPHRFSKAAKDKAVKLGIEPLVV